MRSCLSELIEGWVLYMRSLTSLAPISRSVSLAVLITKKRSTRSSNKKPQHGSRAYQGILSLALFVASIRNYHVQASAILYSKVGMFVKLDRIEKDKITNLITDSFRRKTPPINLGGADSVVIRLKRKLDIIH